MDKEPQEEPEISPQKLEANRRNALKSTGPKTEEGKRYSSRNAIKHGLFSKDLVLPGKESREEFDEFFKELIEDLQPQGRAELALVEIIASDDWRHRRSLRAERADIVGDPLLSDPVSDRVLPNANVMNNILRYQTTIHRQKMQTFQLLKKLQQRRRNRRPASSDAESDTEEK